MHSALGYHCSLVGKTNSIEHQQCIELVIGFDFTSLHDGNGMAWFARPSPTRVAENIDETLILNKGLLGKIAPVIKR